MREWSGSLRWNEGPQFAIGDVVEVDVRRSWREIWWDRIRRLTWRVPPFERRAFRITATTDE